MSHPCTLCQFAYLYPEQKKIISTKNKIPTQVDLINYRLVNVDRKEGVLFLHIAKEFITCSVYNIVPMSASFSNLLWIIYGEMYGEHLSYKFKCRDVVKYVLAVIIRLRIFVSVFYLLFWIRKFIRRQTSNMWNAEQFWKTCQWHADEVHWRFLIECDGCEETVYGIFFFYKLNSIFSSSSTTL